MVAVVAKQLSTAAVEWVWQQLLVPGDLEASPQLGQLLFEQAVVELAAVAAAAVEAV